MRNEIPSIPQTKHSVLFHYADFILCYLKYGCVLDQYVRGGFALLSSKQRDESVTYRRITKVYRTLNNPAFTHILKEKPEFNSYFATLIKRKWLDSKDLVKRGNDVFRDVDELIVKPTDSSEGNGIFKVLLPKDNDEREKTFARLSRDNVIVEERLFSHPVTQFGSSSLNTIRAHSIIDDTGNVRFMKFILRVGVGDTMVDNYCSGGCIYEVDEYTGRIISPGFSKKHLPSEFHPGTNIKMPGLTIPFWDEVKALVIEAHQMLPQIRYIGWDVAITENGPELIEGNHLPDYELLEFVGTRFWWPRFKKYVNL